MSGTKYAADTAAPEIRAERSVRRAKQLARVKDSPGAKLVVLHAPAGFGKTTLLRQYCAELETSGTGRGIWIQLEPSAADPVEFIRVLLRALEHKGCPDASERNAGPIRNPSVRDLRAALERAGAGTALVIDDFEQADRAATRAVLDQLLRQLPEGVTIFLGTRISPAGLLSRLMVTGEAILIDRDDLRFGAAETEAFFGGTATLDKDELSRVHSFTDGWPAALQCYRLCMNGGRLRRGLAYRSNGVTPELINYLATDVFETLDERTRQLLLTASLPERVCPELVEHISDVRCNHDDLERIVQVGLFLSPIGLERRWYRFHNVFRQFLLTQLSDELDASQIQARQKLAADWYVTNGYEEDAILHFLEAGDKDSAATIIDRRVDSLVNEERLGFIISLVDRLPGATVQKYPAIQNAAIIAYGFCRDFAKANKILEFRRRALERMTNDVSEEDWGVFNSLQIFVLAGQDRVHDFAARAEMALDQLSPKHRFLYGVALNAHSFWLQANSKFEQARDELAEARPILALDHSLFGQAYQEGIASTVLTAQGRVLDSIGALRTALHSIEQSESSGAGTTVAAYLAEAYYERNEAEAASALFEDYLPLIERQAIVDPLAIACLTRARIAKLEGDASESERLVEHMMELGHGHDLPRLVHYGHAELVRQATLDGDIDLAGRRVDVFFGGTEPRMEPDLLFHPSETEAQTVTYARYLIHAERYGEARSLIQPQLRKAKLLRRRRRQMKLGLLMSLALDAEGETSAARRALLDALHLGLPGGLIRSILDEGPKAVRLLKELVGTLPRMPDLPNRDDLVRYVERLLHEAGENVDIEETIQAGVLDDNAINVFDSLTERERDILRLVSNGFSNKDLAERLSLSTNTVKWHLRNIYDKLQIDNRVQAVSVARHFGLID